MDEKKYLIDVDEYSEYMKLIEKMMRFINLYREMDDTPRCYGTDTIYYQLEIHTIHIIGQQPGINVTGIANYHNISKSAVSQVIKKVEKKGAVYRYKSLENKKEVLFKLTEEGERAYCAHIEYHKKLEIEWIKKFRTIPYEKIKNFEEILSIFEERIKVFYKK